MVADEKQRFESLDRIKAHLHGFLGDPNYIFLEIHSVAVAVDLIEFAPSTSRNFWTYVTRGMSDLPMKVPTGHKNPSLVSRAELVISLPPDWVPDGLRDINSFRDDKKWWPLRWLKTLARYPHLEEKAVWIGHSLDNGNPPDPVGPDTSMVGFILGTVATWPQDLWQFHLGGNTVTFFGAYPAYAEEIAFKNSKGATAFFDLLDEAQVSELLDPKRVSVVPKH